MTPLNSNILVRFHDEIDTPAGIIIPERYTVYNQEMEGDNESRMGVTTDRRLINPQVVTILSGEHEGEDAFVYYGSYELAKFIDEEKAVIKGNNVLFLLDPIRPMPGIYICEKIWNEGDKTPTGIYTTTNAGSFDALRMKLLYAPENSILTPGQAIITTDKAQYEFRHRGRKYVMVREQFIAGYDKETPYGDNLLVEYFPDPSKAERDVHNDKIREQLDFMKHHGMHYNEADFALIKEPKTVEAKVFLGDGMYEKHIIHRNVGVSLGENKWIIPKEALLGMIQ